MFWEAMTNTTSSSKKQGPDEAEINEPASKSQLIKLRKSDDTEKKVIVAPLCFPFIVS